jgi:septal ring factor EnvC (AmiA/AmiB activator)
MSRIRTFLNTIGDIATVLYTFSFLMLQLVSVGVMIVIFFDCLCMEGGITTDRTYVLMATTAVVIVIVATVFCHVVTDALFDVKMATALRIAMKVDSITTPQKAAELVDHWTKESRFRRSEYFKAVRERDHLESQITELREKNETLESANDTLQSENAKLREKNKTLQSANNTLQSEKARLQHERAVFCFILNDCRYMNADPTTTATTTAPAPAVVAAAGAQV